MKFDLHCHTTCSDGTYTPQQLVELALKIGLDGIAITDHDTIAAFFELEKTPLVILPGVEISAEIGDENVHVLGYCFELNNKAFQEFCSVSIVRRRQRNQQIFDKLTALGMPLTEEDIIDPSGKTVTYGRPHIAQAMVRKGYVKAFQEAFSLYIGSHKPCYVAGEKWSPEEAIEALHHAQGFAVIAHPHLIARQSVVRKLLTLPFDGIECYYSRATESTNAKWVRIAEEKNWLKTGGSDFHGSIKPNILLGCSVAPKETAVILLERFKSQ